MIDAVLVVGAIVLVGGGIHAIAGRFPGAGRTPRRRLPRAAAALAVAGLAVVPAAFQLSRSRSVQLFGESVRRVETEARVVALTFDDGPSAAGGDRILEILADEGVQATFFVIGREVEENPEVARRMVAAGHELGNHTYTHRRMIGRSMATIREEVERTDAAIRRAGYAGAIHFRAPNSHKLAALPLYLARTGRTSVSWDVEPDSDPATAAASGRIVEHVKANVRPGSIVLLHVMYPSRAEVMAAVPGIIRELRGLGYRFVTVTELLRLRDGAQSAAR